jgi:hypothetical protein
MMKIRYIRCPSVYAVNYTTLAPSLSKNKKLNQSCISRNTFLNLMKLLNLSAPVTISHFLVFTLVPYDSYLIGKDALLPV